MDKFKEITPLSKDENGALTYAPFVANGNTYKFIKPGDPIGPKKWTMYEQLKVVFGTGKTFGELATHFKQQKELLGADKPFAEIRVEAILSCDSMQRSIVEMSKERYNQAFFLCSIFIYKEGTDPYDWSMDIAKDMIDDWAEERINEHDLFFFSFILTPGLRQIYAELQARAESQAVEQWGDSTLKKMEP